MDDYVPRSGMSCLTVHGISLTVCGEVPADHLSKIVEKLQAYKHGLPDPRARLYIAHAQFAVLVTSNTHAYVTHVDNTEHQIGLLRSGRDALALTTSYRDERRQELEEWRTTDGDFAEAFITNPLELGGEAHRAAQLLMNAAVDAAVFSLNEQFGIQHGVPLSSTTRAVA